MLYITPMLENVIMNEWHSAPSSTVKPTKHQRCTGWHQPFVRQCNMKAFLPRAFHAQPKCAAFKCEAFRVCATCRRESPESTATLLLCALLGGSSTAHATRNWIISSASNFECNGVGRAEKRRCWYEKSCMCFSPNAIIRLDCSLVVVYQRCSKLEM